MPKLINNFIARLQSVGVFGLSRDNKAYQGTGLGRRVVRRMASRTKRDIADWKIAERRARSTNDPRWYLLQDLYCEIMNDALLSSQVQNRISRSLTMPYELTDRDGAVLDEQTATLRQVSAIPTLIRAIIESQLYGYSLVEIEMQRQRGGKVLPGTVEAASLPRRNVDPVFGRFFLDTQEDKCIPYRELSGYGTALFEFGDDDDLGLLNKTVPHVLFKKFAQSCWSELCEIYGVPPRYLKTNTTDPEMLARGEQMMREMGHAAAFVIDSNEEFSFAAGVQTKGEVYDNLIRLCNQEVSLLISGAIVGQDTANGNYSKEQASIEMLDRVAEQDRRLVERYMNSTIIPALQRLHVLPEGELLFRFCAAEDLDKLWNMVREVLPYKDVDTEWIEDRFGIPVRDRVVAAEPASESNPTPTSKEPSKGKEPSPSGKEPSSEKGNDEPSEEEQDDASMAYALARMVAQASPFFE